MNTKKIISVSKYIGLVALFIAGFMAHDPVTNTTRKIVDFVYPASVQSYTVKLSEYDQRTKDLFTSPEYQKICEYSARSIVALELADIKKDEAINYVGEFEKYNTLAQFTRPSTQAVSNRATSTVKSGTIADVIK